MTEPRELTPREIEEVERRAVNFLQDIKELKRFVTNPYISRDVRLDVLPHIAQLERALQQHVDWGTIPANHVRHSDLVNKVLGQEAL